MADITYTIEAIDKTTGVMRNISSAITGLNQGVQLLNQAYRTAQQVINATVGEYVKYANQVRTITQVTGQSAEAVSRMIQVSDDYKISTEQLTLAMKKLAGEGLELTTDSLARMSDEYLKLAPGVERQTFLTEKFGRQGIAFAEIMLAGGDAIRAQSDAISDNLILTDEALKRARDYEKAVDNLNDSVYGLKITLGAKLVPALDEVTRAVTATLNGMDAYYHLASAVGYAASGQWSEAQAEFALAAGIAADSLNAAGLGAEEATTALDEFGNAVTTSTPVLAEYSSVLSGLSGTLAEAAFAQIELALQTKYGAENYAEAEAAALGYALSMGLIDTATYTAKMQVLGLNTALATLPDGVSVDVMLNILTNLANPNWDPYGAVSGANTTGYNNPAAGSTSGWVRAGTVNGPGTPTVWYGPNGQVYQGDQPPGKAGGGAFSGWAMVGDSAGGGRTPYTEYVYAPHGAVVYNQKQMSGQSAPPMAGGGVIPPMQSPNIVTLSPQSVRDLADALSFKLQPYL